MKLMEKVIKIIITSNAVRWIEVVRRVGDSSTTAAKVPEGMKQTKKKVKRRRDLLKTKFD